MRWQGLKVPVIIFSLLAGMAFIFGAQWLYQKYSFEQPLNAALNRNKAVDSFQVSNEGRLLRVSVMINYNAGLMEAYEEIRRELAGAAGGRPVQLVLNDSRDDTLKQAWYNSQYAVYQAVSQGSYQDMAAVVNREAGTLGAEAEIYINQENIFIRLKHQGHTLDEVIPRNVGQTDGNVQATGAGGGVRVQRN